MKSGKFVISLSAIIGLSSFSFAFAAENSDASPDGTRRLIAAGEGHAKGGRWEKARDSFLQACSQEPSNVVALHDLAVAYAHTDELSEAADCERKALAANDTYVPSHIELAFVLQKLNDLDAAKEHLKRAIELEPNNQIAKRNLEAMNLPKMHWSKGDAAAPVKELEQTELSELPAIASEVKTAKTTETPVSKALVNRGLQMYRQGKLEVAKRCFQQALENCPDSSIARNALAVVLGSAGDYEGEIRESKKVIDSESKNSVAWCNLGWAQAGKGELKDALLSYQKAIELNPSLVDAQAGQGLLLFRSGKTEAAIAVLKEAVKSKPELAQNHLALGAVLEGNGNFEAALEQFAEAVKLAPGNYEAKTRLAAAQLASGNYAKSAELYKQVIEQKPADPELRIGLGLALTKMGDFSSAFSQFKKASELDKNSAAPHACLSMLEEAKGKLAEAEQEARLAQEKEPGSEFLKESAERLAKSRRDSEM